MTTQAVHPPGVITRTAWLMLGAAIGLAAALLSATLATTVAGTVGVSNVLVMVVCLAPVPLLALVPGVRELELTAARSMLSTEVELVDGPVRSDHRWRMIGWVTLHLTGGLLAAFLLLGVGSGAIAVTIGSLAGAEEMMRNLQIPVATGPGQQVLLVATCVLISAGCVVAVWAIGLGLGRLAPLFLGPTWRDRLAVAEYRLAAEVEHTRLARELHDGIGHALTLISVQAVAGRRVLDRDPRSAGASLQAIEGAARTALTELDTMLGILRDGPADRATEPDLGQLDRLLAMHRDNGLDLVDDVAPVVDLPPLVSRSAYRIVGEALTNAQRHAAAGRVRLVLARQPDALRIEVSNPRPTHDTHGGGDAWRPGTARGGRGLIGITERLKLFGGTLEAGPEDDRWVLRAILPTGERRG